MTRKFFLFAFFLTFSFQSFSFEWPFSKAKKIVEEKPSPIKEKEQVIIPELKALVFQKTLKPCHNCTGFVFDQVDVPNKNRFVQQMRRYLGKPITWSKLQEIKKEVVQFYRKQGFPLVGVRIPSGQDVSSGRVYFLVHRARLGELHVE